MMPARHKRIAEGAVRDMTRFLVVLMVTACAVAVEAPADKPTLQNEWVQVVIDPAYAAIEAVELPGVEPLDLPEYLDAGEPVANDEVPVLGHFNQTGVDPSSQRHNLLYDPRPRSIAAKDPPWQEPWQVEEASDTVVVLRSSNPDGTLHFTLRYELQADRPTIVSSLEIRNAGEARDLPLALVALNGIYYDFGPGESYYSGLFRVDEQNTLERLDQPEPGTWGESFSLDENGFFCMRSRFFGAYWQLLGVQRDLPPPPEQQTPAVTRGPETEPAPSTATGKRARVVVRPRGFIDGRDGATQQAWFKVAFESSDGSPLHVAADDSITLRWQTTATILTHEAMSHLTEAEQELEYPDGFLRFFRILSIAMSWMLTTIQSGFALIGLPEIGFGLSVIVVTLLIKAAMHRLTIKQQRSMMMMQKLAPEIKKLKAQYGNNQQVFAQKQMELWRKHGVNPFSGCLPLLVQMPIFIALYWTFSLAADLRGHGFLWVQDLTLADNTFYLGFSLPLLGPATINLLPILYMLFSLWMGLSQKPPAGADEMQQQMAKMMRWLPVIFGLIFYRMPAGLVLYFTVNIVLSTLEMRYVRRKLGMN
ncbi:MAG: membrane protein insertase YidC [Planctomycetota bacterium]